MAFTYLFRDLQVLELRIDHLLPLIAGRSKVKVWNKGCATEPHSEMILAKLEIFINISSINE